MSLHFDFWLNTKKYELLSLSFGNYIVICSLEIMEYFGFQHFDKKTLPIYLIAAWKIALRYKKKGKKKKQPEDSRNYSRCD